MKKITIIGGGISGLSLLHYLLKELGPQADITLYEREASPGGTIHTANKDSCLFEWGPSGFLDNQPVTGELIKELDLSSQLVEAKTSARRRYIQLNGKLCAVPTNPLSF